MPKPIEIDNAIDISRAVVVKEKRQNFSNGHRDSDNIKINDPVSFSYDLTTGTFSVRSFCMFTLQDVQVRATLDGKEYILERISNVKPLDHDVFYFTLSVADLSRYKNFELVIKDADYQKLKNIDACWKVNLGKTTVASGENRMNATNAKYAMFQFTNLAYVMQSAELEVFLRNYEKFVGHKMNRLPIKDVPSQYTFTEEQKCYDFKKESDLKEFYKNVGVRGNKTWGGFANHDTVSFSCGTGRGDAGQSKATQAWDKVGGGWEFDIGDICMPVTSGQVIHRTLMHEMAHVWGFLHFSSLCYGEFTDTEFFLARHLANLLSATGKLPYASVMPQYTGKPRAGFNAVEKFIYENQKLFPKYLSDYIKSEKTVRASNLDTVTKKINDEFKGVPDALKMMMIAAPNYKSVAEIELHPADVEIYQEVTNMSKFYKL